MSKVNYNTTINGIRYDLAELMNNSSIQTINIRQDNSNYTCKKSALTFNNNRAIYKNDITTDMIGLSEIGDSIITFGPFLVFLGILIYMIYLLGVNFNKIASGNISSSYYNFMYIFIVLLMVQIYIFYNSIQSVQFKTTSTINSVTSTLIYLLELVNIIVVITIGIILKYFSTDG